MLTGHSGIQITTWLEEIWHIMGLMEWLVSMAGSQTQDGEIVDAAVAADAA